MAQVLEVELQVDAPDEEFSATLSGRFYLFTKVWNGREGSWYLSIFDENGDPISVGAKVYIDTPLFKRCQDPRLPAGTLMVHDTTSKRENPGLADLGDRARLYYYEVD